MDPQPVQTSPSPTTPIDIAGHGDEPRPSTTVAGFRTRGKRPVSLVNPSGSPPGGYGPDPSPIVCGFRSDVYREVDQVGDNSSAPYYPYTAPWGSIHPGDHRADISPIVPPGCSCCPGLASQVDDGSSAPHNPFTMPFGSVHPGNHSDHISPIVPPGSPSSRDWGSRLVSQVDDGFSPPSGGCERSSPIVPSGILVERNGGVNGKSVSQTDDKYETNSNEIESDGFSSESGDYFGYRNIYRPRIYEPPNQFRILTDSDDSAYDGGRSSASSDSDDAVNEVNEDDGECSLHRIHIDTFVCDPEEPFESLFDEDVADAYNAEEAALHAGCDPEWIETLMRMAGVDADDDEVHRSVRPGNESPEPPSANWSDSAETVAFNDAMLGTLESVNDMLVSVSDELDSVSRELQDTKEKNFILQLERDEARAKNLPLKVGLQDAKQMALQSNLNLAAAQKTNKTLVDQLQRAKLEILGLKLLAEESKTKVLTAQLEAKEHKEDKAAVQADMEGAKELAQLLQQERDEAHDQCQYLQEETRGLREELCAAQLTVQDGRVQISALQQELAAAAIGSGRVLQVLEGDHLKVDVMRHALVSLRSSHARLMSVVDKIEGEISKDDS